jgi:hypothetical protein
MAHHAISSTLQPHYRLCLQARCRWFEPTCAHQVCAVRWSFWNANRRLGNHSGNHRRTHRGVGKGPQGRGSIIFDHEGAPYTDSRYHRYCRGRWRAVLSKGFGPDGRRRRYKVRGRTKQDVVDALKRKSEELDAGLSTSRSYTVEAAARDWLEYGLPGRSERPREVYRDALAPLLAKIGRRPHGPTSRGNNHLRCTSPVSRSM